MQRKHLVPDSINYIISLNPFCDCEKHYQLQFVGNAYSKTTADILTNLFVLTHRDSVTHICVNWGYDCMWQCFSPGRRQAITLTWCSFAV